MLTRIAYAALGMEPLPPPHSMEYLVTFSKPLGQRPTISRHSGQGSAQASAQGAAARRLGDDEGTSVDQPQETDEQLAARLARQEARQAAQKKKKKRPAPPPLPPKPKKKKVTEQAKDAEMRTKLAEDQRRRFKE